MIILFIDLIKKNRSYRRFHEEFSVPSETLEELVDYARLSPSGANQQPFKFIISNTPECNEQIFPTTTWAGYLKDWKGPEKGERPSAYIIIVGDTEIKKSFGCDHGIAAQSIMLGAVEKGLGGCIIGAFHKEKLREALRIPEHYEPLLILALGKPSETVVLEEIPPNGDIQYWRDEQNIHRVPKRKLKDIIISLKK